MNACGYYLDFVIPAGATGPTGPQGIPGVAGATSNGEKWHTYKIINRIIQYPILTLLETIFLNHSTFLKVL